MAILLSPRRSVPVPAALLFALVASGRAQAPETSHVEAIRFWSFGDVTRVAIETSGDYRLSSEQIENPSRVYFDLNGLHPPTAAHHGMQTIPVGDHRIKEIRLAEVAPGKTRIVFDLECPVEVISSQLVNPDRLMIEIRPKGAGLPALSTARSVTGSERINLSRPPAEADTDTAIGTNSEKPLDPAKSSSAADAAARSNLYIPGVTRVSVPFPSRNTAAPINNQTDTSSSPIEPGPVKPSSLKVVSREPLPRPVAASNLTASVAPAKNDSGGDRSLVRLFGLKLGRVVIDPGHGGKDTGTVGPNGLMEKELVLDVALRLGKLIARQLGAEVVYTRSTDVFIPLEERTRIANQQRADLFISVHANSSIESSATGVETYYFNLNSDRTGLDLAMRENASAGSAISDLNDLLHRAVLQTKLEESREFAQKVQASLCANSTRMNSRARDRGVRQAPFVVLIGATMPSILAEIGFVSNPHDEKLMKRNDQRERIAEALLKGVSQYANSLSHTQMARAHSD